MKTIKNKNTYVAFQSNVRVFIWRRHPDLNWGIRVLQTLALPLGYDAL